MADTLDRERDFSTFSGHLPLNGKAVTRQDGKYYGHRDEFIAKDPTYKPPSQVAVEAKDEDTFLDKAKDILGGLSPDPRAQVRRENAAAKQAELTIGRENE